MAIVLLDVVWQHDSGLAADRKVNTFHFDMPVVSESIITAGVDQDIRSFYGDTPAGGTNEIKSYLGSRLTGVAELRYYDLSTPIPRVPVTVQTADFSVGFASTCLPEEVAFALSYQALPAAGIPQARRRGRIFLGPLASNTNVVQATNNPRPASVMIEDCRRAMRDLLAASNADATYTWVVFSRRNNAGYAVNNGWVDDSFDTQRRRGDAPTTRSVWTATTP